MFNRLVNFFSSKKRIESTVVVPRNQHSISRKNISKNALKVMYRLNEEGYAAYLVGGGVRDLLLGCEPKDFDVATNATPEQVCDIFSNSRIIGRRFRLVHVFFRGENIEVSTFRANVIEENDEEDGNVADKPLIIAADNTFGTMEEDAWRRDFTINALYYGVQDFSVMDYVGGLEDIHKRRIRMIGDPVQRYHEDPVRILRALRLSAKLKLSIESGTEKPIFELMHLLKHVPSARLLDEVQKLFFEGYARANYDCLLQYRYLAVLFPETAGAIQRSKSNAKFINLAIDATDERFHEGKSLNPGFLFSVFLWPALQNYIEAEMNSDSKFFTVLHQGMSVVFDQQAEAVMIPRRLTAMIQSIWVLQYHLERRRGKRVFHAVEHRYFRAALDFLELRAQAGEDCAALAKWWRKFYDAKQSIREKMLSELNNRKNK